MTNFKDIEYTNGQPIEFTVEATETSEAFSDFHPYGDGMAEQRHGECVNDFEITEAKIWDTKREHFTLITNDKFIKKIYLDNFNAVIETLNG